METKIWCKLVYNYLTLGDYILFYTIMNDRDLLAARNIKKFGL